MATPIIAAPRGKRSTRTSTPIERKLAQVPQAAQYEGSSGHHYDVLRRAVNELEAALLLSAVAGEDFHNMADEQKHTYQWMLHALAEKACEHAEFLSIAEQREPANG